MITHTYSGHVLRLYIDDLLHLSMGTWVAIQSWFDDEDTVAPYKIEYYLGKHGSVLTEYDTKEKWTTILGILDSVERFAW